MGTGFDDWVYWQFFTIAINYSATANLPTSQITRTCSILVLVLPTALSIQLTLESESYVTTDGQSASLSWNKAPIWGLRLCWGSHVIVTQPVHWCAGCCLPTVPYCCHSLKRESFIAPLPSSGYTPYVNFT
jgi:hypothetical protein